MPRRKVTTPPNTAAVIDLDDDETLVEEVTTTKRIGRQRREPEKEVEPETIDVEVIEEPADDVPEFSETSLAHLIYGDGEQPIDSQYCTIAVRRNPDSMNDKFLVPCGALTSLPPLRNVELTADRMDIEERVRAEYGGGPYFFQIHFKSRLTASWKATLSDDPRAVAAARQPKPTTGDTQSATQTVVASDPVDTFLDNLEKQKRMRDLLFGDTEQQLRSEIARLQTEAATRPADAPPPPQSEQLVILEKALTATTPDLQERLLEYAFPSKDESGGRHWFADTVSVVIENKDTILGFLGPLLGLGGGQPVPQQSPTIADLMRTPAPTELPTLPTGFRRREPEPETPADTRDDAEPVSTIETPTETADTDANAVDAEIVEETKNEKGRKRN